MRDRIKILAITIDNLIKGYSDKKNIELRYKVGHVLNNFYSENKDIFSRSDQDLDADIKSFYKENNLRLTDSYWKKIKNNTNWDKIKIALSDWLNKKYKEYGFGTSNLGYMLQFYRKYRNTPEILDHAFRLEWSHNVELIKDKINEDERIFYLKKAYYDKWSVKELIKQINEESYDDFLKVLEQSLYQYQIENIIIKNYKSLVDITLDNPSKFLVFAGANATGKSSIFEAIELLIHVALTKDTIAFDLFGGIEDIVNYNAQKNLDPESLFLEITLELSFQAADKIHHINFGLKYDIQNKRLRKDFTGVPELDTRIIDSFSRIFIDNFKRAENKLKVHNKLWFDASNTNKILKKILEIDQKKKEITEWLQILIPEIERVDIKKDLSGKEELHVIEKAYPKRPFIGNLISEGTYNIIALLTLFYQSDEPQFICLEEPENGLNPAILQEMVPFFRDMTNKYGHHIWVTTHSTSLVAQLYEDELIVVNKKEGKTNIYPVKPGDFEKMKPDEAWMSNMLKGGGLPW